MEFGCSKRPVKEFFVDERRCTVEFRLVEFFNFNWVDSIRSNVRQTDAPFPKQNPIGCGVGMIDSFTHKFPLRKYAPQMASIELIVIEFTFWRATHNSMLTDRSAFIIGNQARLRHVFQIFTCIGIFSTIGHIIRVLQCPLVKG